MAQSTVPAAAAAQLLLAGFLLNEMGVSAFTPMFYAFKERELILDLFEEASGSRVMCNYMSFGAMALSSGPWANRNFFLQPGLVMDRDLTTVHDVIELARMLDAPN